MIFCLFCFEGFSKMVLMAFQNKNALEGLFKSGFHDFSKMVFMTFQKWFWRLFKNGFGDFSKMVLKTFKI